MRLISFSKKTTATVLLCSLVLLLNTLYSSVNITLDGSLSPDSNSIEGSNPTNNNALYSKAVFSGTSWQADAGFLKMNTTPNAGIWFGAFPGYSDPAAFFPSDEATGSSLRLTSLLTNGSKSWSMQITDTDGYGGFFLFDFTESTDNADNMPGVWIITPTGSIRVTDDEFNLNVLHTYEIHLSGGGIVYTVDGDEVYRGEADQVGPAGSYFIGDTSGSTISGTGSMWIDYMEFNNAAGSIGAIPEPANFTFLLGLSALTCVRLRRHKR